MADNKSFWMVINVGLTLFYAWAGFTFWQNGDITDPIVLVSALILGFHVLEIPAAFLLLKEKKPSALRVILGTTLYGFTWWLPVKRGVYAAR